MNSRNFITIQGWMISELNLKGNDLLIYAIIYGFSQTEGQYFTGSLSYLAEWTNSTKQGVQKNLKSLIDKGLILKLTINEQIVYTTQLHIDKQTIQLSCTNNIDNSSSIDNSNNINNKNIRSKKKEEEPKDNFLGTLNEEKPKKKNRYEQCVDVVYEYTSNPELAQLLITYLKMRLEMTDAPMYVNQWRGLMNQLNKLAHSLEEALAIVQQSINRGYRGFFPAKEYKNDKCGFNEVISKPTAEAQEIQQRGKDISGEKF